MDDRVILVVISIGLSISFGVLALPCGLFAGYLGVRGSELGRLTRLDEEPLFRGFVKYLRGK